jgi:hypothetical protein
MASRLINPRAVGAVSTSLCGCCCGVSGISFGTLSIGQGMGAVVFVKGKDSYSLVFSFARTAIPVLALLILVTARASAQCSDPGLQLAGEMSVQGSFNKNANATQEVLLPEGVVELDASWHQSTLKAYGGGSDARSPLRPSDVPAGICIVASGNEENEKGWAVHSPSLHVAADDGTRVTRRAFSMTLYCTVGSNELDRLVGPCAVKVRVYYKPKGAS